MTMKQEIEQAIFFCIEALNNRTEDSGQEVEGNDKYVIETIRKISELPYQGRNLGIGDFGYKEHRRRFEDRPIGKRITFSLDWLNAILVLFDFANYNEQQILESAEKIVNDNIIFNHIMKHIITNCVVMNDIELAEKFIPNFKKTIIFKEENNLDMGYLIILKYYAMKGDVENFFKYFKQSKPSVNRSEIGEAKFLLVNNFATNNGIEKSIELCKHKNLGASYYYSALMSVAEQGKYNDLKEIFVKYPELKQPELETELKVLTSAYLAGRELNLTIDDDFETLFERALQVNRKLKWGEIKLQDSIFLDLGLASNGDIERVVKCRKAIKDNRLKKELIIK